MKTVEVSNAYNVRRQQLVAELEYADKELRGLLTRSILNTDLSVSTYEVLINSIVKIREFDRFNISEIDKKAHEAKKWISEYNDSINRVINNGNRKKLVKTVQHLETLITQKLEPLQFLEHFYIGYFDINLTILEDTLIQIYISEDTSIIYGETSKMLDDLIGLHPLGGLTSIFRSLFETCTRRYSAYDSQHVYNSFVDIYSDTAFMWSQASQLVIDYVNTLQFGGQASLENSNDNVQSRMKYLVDRYQGKRNTP